MESNPEIMTDYLQKLGVSEQWRLVDVIGLENDALNWIQRPVLALLLLFPLPKDYEQHCREQERDMEAKSSYNVFHVKQSLSNYCGPIALVHGVANNTDTIELRDGLLKSYLEDVKGMDATAKGAFLETSVPIMDVYRQLTPTQSQESTQGNEPPSHHFITFVHKDGYLFELDGRKEMPINHGPTTPETFLEDAAAVCRKFIVREPDNFGFNIMALVPAQ